MLQRLTQNNFNINIRTEKPVERQDTNSNNTEGYQSFGDELYFYHPDHLGSATFLTDHEGLPYQFFLNLPFGESMAEQRSYTGSFDNRWKFTGKELDEETGLYYFGARFYNPSTSIWLSVDPLSEKYPNISPYVYVANNPILYVDPDGREIIPAFKSKANEKKYNSILSQLKNDPIFNRIYSDLHADYDKFIVSEFTNSTKKNYPNAVGIFIPAFFSTFITSDENYIQFNDNLNGFKAATIYEEFFHAGQSEFGGTYSTQTGKEVEAKIATVFSVYKSLSIAQRNDPAAVMEALNEFGVGNAASFSLIIYNNNEQKYTFRKGVKNYFDAILNGNISNVREKNFRKELKNYGNYLQYKGYGNTILDGDYNGETPYFDKLIKEQ